MLEVNQSAGVVRVNRKPIELSPKEFALLVYLYDHRGAICSKDEISQAVWPEVEPGMIFDYQIENLVRRLRTRVEPDPNNAQVLVTMRGQGYKLDLPR
jgi:DNA-binding response OmpR family regulator